MVNNIIPFSRIFIGISLENQILSWLPLPPLLCKRKESTGPPKQNKKVLLICPHFSESVGNCRDICQSTGVSKLQQKPESEV